MSVLAVFAAAPAHAVPVTVTPTTVVLGPGQATVLLTITNEGDTPTRFEAAVNAWTESPEGTTQLAPSADLVVFPALIALQPKESKKIRVGTERAPGASEQSYRLILTELPSIDAASGQVEIQVLSKISLPIFLTPRGAQARAAIPAPALSNGILSFDVANTGSSRFVLREVEVTGRGAGGESFALKAPGWYVLANGRRTFRVAINAADCRRTTAIEIKASGDTAPVQTSMSVSPSACGDAQESRFLKADPASAAPS